MLIRKIGEKLIHTLELKIFRQDGVDSINFTRPWVSPFWITSIQVNITLGCYNNLIHRKRVNHIFFSCKTIFLFYKHYDNIPKFFLSNFVYLQRHSTLKLDVTIRFLHQLFSLYFPRSMADQVNIHFLLRPHARLHRKTYYCLILYEKWS
jgi:hypothetical protein